MASLPTEKPDRHRPVHLPLHEKGNRSSIVFVTVCTKDRKRILANAEAVAAILNAWAEADAWLIGRYAIMPDHIHFFCAQVRFEVSLKRWIKFWKARASLAWPHPDEQPLWQEDFWDTQLRKSDSYSSKWEYVRLNPVRHGLVTRAEDWPWAGEIHQLLWYDV